MTVAVAGSKGVLRVWDALSNAGVRKTFGERLKTLARSGKFAASLDEDGEARRARDGVVKLVDEGETDDDDEEGDAQMG